MTVTLITGGNKGLGYEKAPPVYSASKGALTMLMLAYAAPIVHLATLAPDGPTGILYGTDGPADPW